MPDYKEGKIYKITSPNTNDIYIGSTVQNLNQRMKTHRQQPLCLSKHIIASGKAIIELIELFPCDTREELNKREGEFIRTTPNCINKNIAGRTSAEYYCDNREHYSTLNKTWMETHKEDRAIYMTEYVKNNRERINTRQRERRLAMKKKD